uniref:Glyceronephosphate O-acyltransferase n=1 Tax=Sinocyclocheilus grahami TaxID=75366 RepID=A0A672N3Q1_SINGR
ICFENSMQNIVHNSDVSSESGDSTECVAEEASLILDEMAHRLQLSTVRFFVFTLSKAFKRLFRSVCVNEEGIQRLQQAVQEHPVVLLPSHRSYMDFLMMSYLLYMYDLPLPVIAAGMDFMSMKFVGEMLRMSGAFFIRRSFGGDKLYWAVFSEYVKTMLRNGYAPIEFFLEGTRSRTCKSLTPKTGLLNIVMEPFFKGELFDVNLVPVSISYERILEESLYARELLGIPKPKESTSGLLKARRVLSEDYGSMYVYFGHPVSVRSLTEGKITRSQYNLLPRCIPQKPSADTHEFLNDAAFRLVRIQEENMVLKPWVLIATLLLQNPDGMDLSSLAEQTDWLRHLALAFGAYLDWPDHEACSEVISCSLALHRHLLSVSAGHVQLSVTDAPQVESTPEEAVFHQAVVVLSCASYRNQILHVFLRPALLAVAMQSANSNRKDDVYNCFNFLRNMFSNEFILCPGDSVQDFEEACYLLMKRGVLQVLEHEIVMSASGHSTLAFLSSVLDPFLQGYQVVSRYLCEETNENLTEKEFIPAVRNFALKLILAGRLKCYEALSSDLQKNALAAFLRLKAVRKVKVGDQVTLKVNKIAVNSLEDTLGKSDVTSHQNSWCSSMAMFEIAI